MNEGIPGLIYELAHKTAKTPTRRTVKVQQSITFNAMWLCLPLTLKSFTCCCRATARFAMWMLIADAWPHELSLAYLATVDLLLSLFTTRCLGRSSYGCSSYCYFLFLLLLILLNYSTSVSLFGAAAAAAPTSFFILSSRHSLRGWPTPPPTHAVCRFL